jgi:hypothetical protein
MLLVTLLHSVFVVAIVIVLATLVKIFGSSASATPGCIRLPVHLLLLLTNLLSEPFPFYYARIAESFFLVGALNSPGLWHGLRSGLSSFGRLHFPVPEPLARVTILHS